MDTFWKSWVIIATVIIIMELSNASAEEIQSVADTPKVNEQGSETATNQPAGEMPRLVPWLDYTGGIWHSAGLTGDWAGTRQQLMDKGIRFDMSLIQTLQGNWTGGTSIILTRGTCDTAYSLTRVRQVCGRVVYLLPVETPGTETATTLIPGR